MSDLDDLAAASGNGPRRQMVATPPPPSAWQQPVAAPVEPTPPVVHYYVPEQRERRSAPGYQDILDGAWWLRLTAILNMILGGMGLAGCLIVAFKIADTSPAVGGLVIAGGVLSFVFTMAGSAMLRMQAAMGEALRDLARNSYRI